MVDSRQAAARAALGAAAVTGHPPGRRANVGSLGGAGQRATVLTGRRQPHGLLQLPLEPLLLRVLPGGMSANQKPVNIVLTNQKPVNIVSANQKPAHLPGGSA